GRDILGASPGGGTITKSGTSMATPVVSGVAGLLLSLQLGRGQKPNPGAVRAAILHGSDPCDPGTVGDCSRFLVGALNVLGAEQALNAIERNELPMLEQPQPLESIGTEPESAVSVSCRCDQAPAFKGEPGFDTSTSADPVTAAVAERPHAGQ